MKYVLFLCAPAGGEEPGPVPVAESLARASCGAGAGVWLRPAADATTVRVHGDEVLLGDGPFAACEEYVAGLGLIEAADLDEAVAAAARCHAAVGGSAVEVRPVWE